MLDLANQLQSGVSLAPAVRTATANGSSVDFRDCGREVLCELSVGTVTGTSPTLDVKLQDSPDDTTFTDITNATMTQVTASDKHENKWFVLAPRTERYVRAVATIGGTSPSFPCAVVLKARKVSY